MTSLNGELTKQQLEEHRLEIENRIRNLFWTVSGDYSLNIQPDVETFAESKALALYDAVKQGAFAAHFDPEALALYILKKQALGGEGALLTELAQLCVDAAAYPIVRQERSGIDALRQQALSDLLKLDAPGNTDSPASLRLFRLRQSILCRAMNREDTLPPELLPAVEEIEALSGAENTSEIIKTVDGIYNKWLHPEYEKQHGDLEKVLSVTVPELLEYQRSMEMSDAMIDRVLEEYLDALKQEMLRTKKRQPRKHFNPNLAEESEEEPEPSPESREKVLAYMERNFGKSCLSSLEQQRISRSLCKGIHRNCSLFFTQGILKNPALKNTQYLRGEMQLMKNELYFNSKQLPIRRNVSVLTDMLKRVQIQQMDEDMVRADHGQIRASRLWKLGRTRDAKLFDLQKKRENRAFAVDILLDASSSQNIRQPQIAAQAYIISQALSQAKIPHRVTGFCSYWDYTILHRFRDYEDPASANKNILQFRAFGENRDGLAIATVCDSLQQREEENKVLIILSDGRPNQLSISRPGIRKTPVYVGEEAVRDTAQAVRKARNQGIAVLGIFVGAEEDLATEKRIFGKEFTYTKNISSFSHIVGTYLCRMIAQE